MEDAPPPPAYVLQPHHIGILTLFSRFYAQTVGIPDAFAIHVYRMLLNEVSEVSQPKTFQELVQELKSGPRVDPYVVTIDILVNTFSNSPVTLASLEDFSVFIQDLPSLFEERPDDEPPLIMPRSIFGFFIRRSYLTLSRLSYSGLAKIHSEYLSWCKGLPVLGADVAQRQFTENPDFFVYKTQSDLKTWARPESFDAWEKALATGEENIATENLRRFFEQHFHEGNDSGLRQHAVLHLVRMHYVAGEYPAARQLLAEAIAVARTSGDSMTLQHCISMLHRLPPVHPGAKRNLNEFQPDLHPLEVLFDVEKLLDDHMGQPLSAAFAKLTEGIGLYDEWLEAQLAAPVEEEQWAQHGVQSVVWNAAGPEIPLEDTVIAFTSNGSDDNNRLIMLLNKAYKIARRGAYTAGLTMLLDPAVWRGLSMSNFGLWAHEIWHILALRATRRGQLKLFNEFLLPRRPSGPFNPREYFLEPGRISLSQTRDPLHEVLQLQKSGQGTTAVEHLLTGLWHSEFLSRFLQYRTGIILLADIGLQFGMSKRSRRILEEIMPQIILGTDREQRANACFTLARCMLVADEDFTPALRDAHAYLRISEADFQALEMYESLKHVQYLISVICHNLGMEKERDEAIARHFATIADQERLSTVVVDEEIGEIFYVVNMIGAVLAAR